MQKFYTSVHQHAGKIKVRGWKNGRRYQDSIAYKPYLFLKSQEASTAWRSLIGDKPLDKKIFDSIYDAKEFLKKYEDVSNMEIHGSRSWPYVYIFDEFGSGIEYDADQINVLNFDIEVNADEFPDPWKANWPVVSISCEINEKVTVFGLLPWSGMEGVKYVLCDSEEDLLEKFVTYWLNVDPDVLTGWNIDYFDIPYIINRLRKVFGDDDLVKLLSPWKQIDEKTVFHHGENVILYDIVGITSLDYLPLYKKFSFSNEESYTLNNIASVTIGEKKIDYSEYESLQDLYHKDYNKFLVYNVSDVRLVTKIDAKLGFIKQVFAIAYDSLVNFADTFTSVKIWEIIIHNKMLREGVVSPPKKHSVKTKQIAGGYVKQPLLGLHKWVMSFDLDALYPRLISQYNISPETYVDSLDELPSDENSPNRILAGFLDQERRDALIKHNLSLTAGGALFTREKRGFIPRLMDEMYDDRVVFKKKMIEEKKKLEYIEAEIKKRGLKT